MLVLVRPVRACGQSFARGSITHNRRLHINADSRTLELQARVQSYVSTTDNPYLNLSIEHFLLEKSSPESTILFIYKNRPSIVFGRNQNPWVEVNIPLLRATNSGNGPAQPDIGFADLVRRRSGGGTVFHDGGNVNWSVICPPADFTRDKHAEMVVAALRELGLDRARVNERHDIVLDQNAERVDHSVDSQDMHRTAYTSTAADSPRPLKVSGSAYKLTRTRSLHHATCLLSSPNLAVIPQYLHSPARPFIKARGVDSVSSPVGNIGVDEKHFSAAVQDRFRDMYGAPGRSALIGDEMLRETSVEKGYRELTSLDWIYGQTPQFVLSTAPEHESKKDTSAAALPPAMASRLSMTVRHGAVETVSGAERSFNETALQQLEGYRLFGSSEQRESRSIWELKEGMTRSEDAATMGWLQNLLEVPVPHRSDL